MKHILSTLLLAAIGLTATAKDIQLPKPDMKVKMTLMEALSKRASARVFSQKAIDDQTLSTVLWAACGINRPEENKITAPSAINAQDILLYVARADGAWLYEPKTNTLKQVTTTDVRPHLAAGQQFATQAPVSLIMVSDQSRFGRASRGAADMGKYDAGYVSENICLVCTALGLNTVPRMMMDKEKLSQALGLTEQQLPLLNNPIGWPEEKK